VLPLGRPEVTPFQKVLPLGRPEVTPFQKVLPLGRPEVTPFQKMLPLGRPEVTPFQKVLPLGRPEVTPFQKVLPLDEPKGHSETKAFQRVSSGFQVFEKGNTFLGKVSPSNFVQLSQDLISNQTLLLPRSCGGSAYYPDRFQPGYQNQTCLFSEDLTLSLMSST